MLEQIFPGLGRFFELSAACYCVCGCTASDPKKDDTKDDEDDEGVDINPPPA